MTEKKSVSLLCVSINETVLWVYSWIWGVLTTALEVLRVSLYWGINCNKVFQKSSPPSDCLITSEVSYFNSKC